MVADDSGSRNLNIHGAGAVAFLTINAGCGITFDPEDPEQIKYPQYRPIGTSIFTEGALGR